MAGYSDRPLVGKLGIQGGQRILALNAPPQYQQLIGRLPNGTTLDRTPRGEYFVIHIFIDRKQALEDQMDALKEILEPAGMLWVSWPKQTSGVRTDVNENVIRDMARANGLVDVKVVAIDEYWSALKLVRPLKDR